MVTITSNRDGKLTATSTRCTARFPDQGIELQANVPREIPDDPALIKALQQIPGMVIERTEPTTPTAFEEH